MRHLILKLKATHAFKNKEWRKANIYYKQYQALNKPLNKKNYLQYAQSLRNEGKINGAIKLLESISIDDDKDNQLKINYLNELQSNYIILSQWTKALDQTKQLIELEPNNTKHYFQLAYLQTWLKQKDIATTSYQEALGKAHGLPIHIIIKKLRARLKLSANSCPNSLFKLVGGRNSYGFILHESNHPLITKISNYENRANRQEFYFYKHSLEQYPNLQVLAPQFYDAFEKDSIAYLTIEYLEPRHPGKKDLQAVIQFSQCLAKTHITDSDHLNPPKNLKLTRRSSSIYNFFSKIHQTKSNQQLFKQLDYLYKGTSANTLTTPIRSRLKNLIFEYKVYKLIDPKKDYKLIHGDLAGSNLIFKKNSQQLIGIDWGRIHLGLSTTDLAKYAWFKKISFRRIKRDYLEHSTYAPNQKEKIFFLYALIAMHLTSIKKANKSTHKRLKKIIIPALDQLEKTVLNINKT